MDTVKYILDKYNLEMDDVIEIHNVSRVDILPWLRELDFQRGAEIGVASGDYSKLICEINPQMTVYGVDLWKTYDSYTEAEVQDYLDQIRQATMTKLRYEIKEERFIPMEMFSEDAMKEFPDGSLDFIYIDANHEYHYPYMDISGWAKKVRSGGIISGHDWFAPKNRKYTVKEDVLRYLGEENIKPLFLMGSHAKEKGVIRERVRSWAFVKP